MPFIFKDYKDVTEYCRFKSVLIVPCRFCPAASSAVRNNKPYIEFLRRFLKTDSYEREIASLKSNFEKRGIKIGIFRSRFLHQFVLCMWTSRRRNKLRELAGNYDALVVLGCEAAVQSVRDSVTLPSHRVIQGLESEGIMSIQPRFSLLGKVSLELESITPFMPREEQAPES